MKAVVITGVSSGIGLATAQELVTHGYQVFGSVRKAADGNRVREQLGEHFTPLLFDVTDEAAIRAAADEVTETVGDNGLAGLVNNAGLGAGGPLMHLDLQLVRQLFEVNVIGLLAVTQAFLPLLGARKHAPHPPGRIVNLSSVGGQIVFPFAAAYQSTKHAVEALSHGLRRELLLYGIDVVIIGPGSVRTPMWGKAADTGMERFEQTDYGQIVEDFLPELERFERQGVPPEDIARVIRTALESKKPKTRYAILARLLEEWLIPRYLPARWFDRLLARRLGLSRPAR
ncbi:MAG: oxidoreductase [Dehalococcoidia bacterium]|nr:oxidoreductase [Dehalococcoidia bacterium]